MATPTSSSVNPRPRTTLRYVLAGSSIVVFGLLGRPWPVSGDLALDQVHVEHIGGDDPATLVWWEGSDKLAMVTGVSVELNPEKRRFDLERYRIWWPPFYVGHLQSGNSASIPTRWLSGQTYEIRMRDAAGRFVRIGKTEGAATVSTGPG